MKSRVVANSPAYLAPVRAAHEAEEESKLDDDMAINETESDRPNGVHA